MLKFSTKFLTEGVHDAQIVKYTLTEREGKYILSLQLDIDGIQKDAIYVETNNYRGISRFAEALGKQTGVQDDLEVVLKNLIEQQKMLTFNLTYRVTPEGRTYENWDLI